jgi:hypothetical protein
MSALFKTLDKPEIMFYVYCVRIQAPTPFRANILIRPLTFDFFFSFSFLRVLSGKSLITRKEPPCPTPKRRRGGQPGNGNALRHGLYSKYFTEAEMHGLDENLKGEFHDEIALARIQLCRLAEILKDYKELPFEEYIAASNALNNYLDRIQRLSRAQHFMYSNQATLEQALAELADIPFEED